MQVSLLSWPTGLFDAVLNYNTISQFQMFSSLLYFVMQAPRLWNHSLLWSAGFLLGCSWGRLQQEEGGRIFLLLLCSPFLGVTVSGLSLGSNSQFLPRLLPMLPEPHCHLFEVAVVPWSAPSAGQSSRSQRPLFQVPEVTAVAWHYLTLRPGSQLCMTTSNSGTSNLLPKNRRCFWPFCFFNPPTPVPISPYQIPSSKIPSMLSVFLSRPWWKKNVCESFSMEVAVAVREGQGARGEKAWNSFPTSEMVFSPNFEAVVKAKGFHFESLTASLEIIEGISGVW